MNIILIYYRVRYHNPLCFYSGQDNYSRCYPDRLFSNWMCMQQLVYKLIDTINNNLDKFTQKGS